MRTRPTFDELALREAKEIARSTLEDRLRQHHLPLPKDSNLDTHLNKMIELNPEILDLARQRVEAKTDAYSRSLEAIGLGTSEALDLDL